MTTLTLPQVAKLLGVKPYTVSRYVFHKRIKQVARGLYDEASVRAYMADRRRMRATRDLGPQIQGALNRSWKTRFRSMSINELAAMLDRSTSVIAYTLRELRETGKIILFNGVHYPPAIFHDLKQMIEKHYSSQ